MRKSMLLIICIILFMIDYSYAGMAGVVTDKSGSKVVLDNIITKSISLKIGDSTQNIDLFIVKEIKDSNGKLVIVLRNNSEITGSSTSYIKGAWELGEYKISLNKIKSLIISGESKEQKWDKPKGHVASVTDSKGAEVEVYGFSFGYSYSYWMSNCTWSCSKTASSTLEDLPFTIHGGTMIIPFKDIKSIYDVKPVKKYSSEVESKIEILDGKILVGKIGSFGAERISNIKGKTFLGDYSLNLGKVSKIVFDHSKFIHGKKSYSFRSFDMSSKGTLNSKITAKDGSVINLEKGGVCSTRDNGYISSSQIKTIKIKIGESENQIDISKLKSMDINEKTDGKYSTKNPVILTTKKGNVVSAVLNDKNYICGYKDGGYFFYVKLKNLKKIVFK